MSTNTAKQSDVEALMSTSDLRPIINAAEPRDLDILVDYITDRGAGRLSLDGEACKRLISAKQQNSYTQRDRELIAQEILEFGGNTLSNVYRKARNAVPSGSLIDGILPEANRSADYGDIVRDVAGHLKVPRRNGASIAEVEDGILRKILGDAISKMTESERQEVLDQLGVPAKGFTAASMAILIASGRMGGFATYKMATIVANAVAKALIGRGLAFGTTGVMMRGINVALGPIGWAVTALWTLADLASPAYRVTVPCVVQVAYIRQQLVANSLYVPCTVCGETIGRNDRFCGTCGAPQPVDA